MCRSSTVYTATMRPCRHASGRDRVSVHYYTHLSYRPQRPQGPQRYHQLSRRMSLSRPLRQTLAAFRVVLFTVSPEIYARSSPTSARQHGRKPSRAGRKISTITVAPHKYFLALRQPPPSKLPELTSCRFSMHQRVVLSSTVRLPCRIHLHSSLLAADVTAPIPVRTTHTPPAMRESI